MSMATLRAAPAQESLRVGDRLPLLKGQFLSSGDAELPAASSGKIALVTIGFTYQSRFPVEAWGSWYVLLPVHAAIFGGMLRKIAQRAQSGRE